MNNIFLGFLLFVLPLGVDTFAIAAAVGASRLTGSTRWRISAVFVGCEAGMPLVGLALGASIGQTFGSIAGYLSGGLLALLGGYLWWADDDDGEVAKARRLTSARGLALLGLALSISLDELVIGFSLGLGAQAAMPPASAATIIAAIAIQTLVVSQLGLSVGARISERTRERIERLAVPLLIVLGGYLFAEALLGGGLVTAPQAAAIAILTLCLMLCLTLGLRLGAVARGALRGGALLAGTRPSAAPVARHES